MTAYKERLNELEVELLAVDAAIPSHVTRRLRFEPVTLEGLQGVLKDNEALLATLVGKRSFVGVLVTAGRTRAHVTNNSADQLIKTVARIRSSLDLSRGIRAVPMFDVTGAEQLYADVFLPFENTLAQIGHLIYIPDQILEEIPPAILPMRRGGSPQWLGDHLPISILPAIGSLHALRGNAGHSKAPEAFIGFGAPLTKETLSTFRLGSLPRAEEQLQAICRGVGGEKARIVTGAAVTKTAIMTMDLSRFRVLAFATHGLVADETVAFGGPAEAALLLSPEPGDTGLLTTSEIAGLVLDADWVILSACNSAAPDGSFGAEGLSGLAKAFFEAGARSLLVSHWPVSEWTTTRLLTVLFTHLSSASSLSRAAALAAAMREVRSEGLTAHSHPAFWGAFTVVGEGLRPR